MLAFILLLCIRLIGNSLELPQELVPCSSESDIDNILAKVNGVVNLKTEDDSSFELEDIITESTNFSDEDSGSEARPQLQSEHMKQETNISRNGLIDKIKNITSQLGALMKDEGQFNVTNLKITVWNIAEYVKLLANKYNIMELVPGNLQETEDNLRKTISNGIKSALSSQPGKQIGEQIKAMSDRVSTMLGNLSSEVQQQLMNTIGPESLFLILMKINDIETIVGLMENDVEKIVNKTHIIENVENYVSNVIEEGKAYIGEDSVHKIETVAQAVANGVSGAVEEIKKIIDDVNKVEK